MWTDGYELMCGMLSKMEHLLGLAPADAHTLDEYCTRAPADAVPAATPRSVASASDAPSSKHLP